MMLSDWKRKNNFMTVSDGQIKGLIALSITLAIIPFFVFFRSLLTNPHSPSLTDQTKNTLAIEIVEKDRQKGVYFVGPEISSKHLLNAAGIKDVSTLSFKLTDGMKIIIDSDSEHQKVLRTEMDAGEKLALGMPLDINQITEDELLMVKGIGEVNAKNIMDLRNKLGQFRNIEQLMEIKGIKEKKLAELKKFLYVENNQK